MRLADKYIMTVLATLDKNVETTGLPVAGTVLERAGIATRKQLRKLENMGLIESCYIRNGAQAVNAYYTKGVIPNAIRAKQSHATEGN